MAKEYIKDGGRGTRTKDAASKARNLVAQIVWLVCVVCAILLAVGALLVALDSTNRDNELVTFVLQGANAVDLGFFDRKAGIFQFKGNDSEVKNALVNWGLGAVVWLVAGRILDRIIRP